MHPTAKIFPSVVSLAATCEMSNRSDQTLVLTTGVFDILHSGHFEYIYKASLEGNYLVVGVDSDAFTRLVKGPDRPYRPQDDRAKSIAYLSFVDAIVVYDDEPGLIRAVRPDVVVISSTSHVQLEVDPVRAAAINEVGCRVQKFGSTVDIHTTTILEQMRRKDGASG